MRDEKLCSFGCSCSDDCKHSLLGSLSMPRRHNVPAIRPQVTSSRGLKDLDRWVLHPLLQIFFELFHFSFLFARQLSLFNTEVYHLCDGFGFVLCGLLADVSTEFFQDHGSYACCPNIPLGGDVNICDSRA